MSFLSDTFILIGVISGDTFVLMSLHETVVDPGSFMSITLLSNSSAPLVPETKDVRWVSRGWPTR